MGAEIGRRAAGGRPPALALALAALGSAAALSIASAQGPSGAALLISELQYDPPPSGSESAFEWVELHNPGETEVSLAGWRLADNRAESRLPDARIAPGGYLVVAGSRFRELHPGFEGPLLTLPRIGNGLGNAGDRLRLLDDEGRTVDGMSYGEDAELLDPPVPLVPSGHSLARVPAGADRDSAADWQGQEAPSPGGPPSARPPTPTPTPLPSPHPGARPRLNEHLPAPRDVDWDGDGVASRDDEWVELFNAGEEDLDLRGWQLDDLADGGSPPFVFPEGAEIPARGHLLVFKRESGLSLNNDGDEIRLLAPDGRLVDATTYGASRPDESWARLPEGEGTWRPDLPPSPGRANGLAPPASTAGASPTAGAPPLETPESTPASTSASTPEPGASAVPSLSPPAAGTPGAPPVYLPVLISELLYDPEEPGPDAHAEWVELHNPGTSPVELGGWILEDGSARDRLPAHRLPAGGFALVAASEASARALRARGAAVLLLPDGRIGGGLGNEGDVLRLRDPTGAERDAVSWGGNLEALDPAAPDGPPGRSLERIPPGRDRDLAEDWWIQPAPSPGRAGTRHEGPPRIRLSEVLPAPSLVDWDGDGEAGHQDEWVELANLEPYEARPAGWRLEAESPDGRSWSHRLPDDARIPAGGWLMIHRARSGLALRNEGETLRLRRPDGVIADAFTWRASPGYDRSWSRVGLVPDTVEAVAEAHAGQGVEADGASERHAAEGSEGVPAPGWTSDWAVTPGGPNRPLAAGEAHLADLAWDAERARRYPDARRGRPRAPAPPQEARIAELRRMRPRTRVLVRGTVLAEPGLLGTRALYLGDETGGLRAYLRPRDLRLPAFRRGDAVALIGRLADYRGERELRIDRPEDAWWEGEPLALPPLDLRTGAVDEAVEGRLLRVQGRLLWAGRRRWALDDGSGPISVTLRAASGIEAPPVPRGAWMSLVGIASQSAPRAPWQGGYRLLPRDPADVSVGAPAEQRGGPARLPRTGRAAVRCQDGAGL